MLKKIRNKIDRTNKYGLKMTNTSGSSDVRNGSLYESLSRDRGNTDELRQDSKGEEIGASADDEINKTI